MLSMHSQHFVYIDSSEEQPQIASRTPQHPKRICCMADNAGNQLLAAGAQDDLLKRALQARKQGEIKNKLLVNIEDKDLEMNIKKRNANYEYFAQRVIIDQKYEAMQNQKALKLREQNQRKRKVLQKQKKQKELQQEQDHLRKFIVEKKQREERVVEHLKKEIRDIGVKNYINSNKKLKQQLKEQRQRRKNEIDSALNKQSNQLQELQEELEKVREEKRINKIEENKVIKQLKKDIKKQRDDLQERWRKKTTFVI